MSQGSEISPPLWQRLTEWNPRRVFLLVLAIHATLAVVRHDHGQVWDEGRYLECALHLIGKPVPTFDETDFVNGPGYPLVLAPFVALESATIDEIVTRHPKPPLNYSGRFLARLLNAVFIAGAAVFVWLTMRLYTGPVIATIGAVWTGLHPTLVWMSFALMTEPLTIFCLTGFLWAFCRALRSEGMPWRWLLTAVAFLGWLTLTRVFFGHVMTAMVCLCLVLWPIFKAWRPALQRTLLILAGAFLICAPYLHHTWKVTGQFPCWSTNSGELLYWMTSHHPGENGHWFSYEDAQNDPDLAPNHAAFFGTALRLPVAEREALFKQAAKEQFTPAAFAYNWVCNLSRLAFGFPRSFQTEELRTLVLILFNGPLIVLALLSGVLALRHWQSFPVEILLLAAMAAFYLGGSSLAPALPRYFVVIGPILGLVIAVAWQRHVRESLK
jgi:4-amino-4-deoxy-L-arabinose transferase-like glycosyltransferase